MSSTTKFAGLAGAALVALAGVTFGGAVQAQPAYYADGTPAYYAPARPLVVTGRRYAPVRVAPAYDPYAGPQAIITAPLAAASTLVALPFRVVNGVFPAQGNPAQNPLVIVGAPVHAAGQIAQVPFHILQAPFGGPVDADF